MIGKKRIFLNLHHTEERAEAFGYWNQKGSLWAGGGRVGEWVVVGSAAGLVSWLVGRSERANAAPCASSLYLDDKEPNLTQWNGRMVMETAFNLHRRSLFVDSLKVGVLLARSGPLASLLALYFASLRFAMKRALSFIYHLLDRIFYSDYTSPASKTVNLFMIAHRRPLWRRKDRRRLRKADSTGEWGTLIKDARV